MSPMRAKFLQLERGSHIYLTGQLSYLLSLILHLQQVTQALRLLPTGIYFPLGAQV